MSEDVKKPTKSELIIMLDEMILNIERLPLYAMTAPVTNYDHCALMILLAAILRSKDDHFSSSSVVCDPTT